MIKNIVTGVAIALTSWAMIFTGVVGAESASAANPLCAYQEGMVVNGTTVTATFHVVANGCQVSLVTIRKLATTSELVGSATGVFNASETRATLSAQLPCGGASEADLILGPPSLYPNGDNDLHAQSFSVACPVTPPKTTPPPPVPPPPPSPPARMGYCLNGVYLDLEAGQPNTDPKYKGAVPAVNGTCQSTPPPVIPVPPPVIPPPPCKTTVVKVKVPVVKWRTRVVTKKSVRVHVIVKKATVTKTKTKTVTKWKTKIVYRCPPGMICGVPGKG